MKNKLTIDLNKTEEGYNGITRQPYLWTIIDEGKEMYEVQIIKLNFPSTKKDITCYSMVATINSFCFLEGNWQKKQQKIIN